MLHAISQMVPKNSSRALEHIQGSDNNRRLTRIRPKLCTQYCPYFFSYWCLYISILDVCRPNLQIIQSQNCKCYMNILPRHHTCIHDGSWRLSDMATYHQSLITPEILHLDIKYHMASDFLIPRRRLPIFCKYFEFCPHIFHLLFN